MAVSAGSATAGDAGPVSLPVSGTTIQNVQWSAKQASPGLPVDLTADLSGFDATATPVVKVKIFTFVGAWPPVQLVGSELTATVQGGATSVHVAWTPPTDNPPSSVVPYVYIDGGP